MTSYDNLSPIYLNQKLRIKHVHTIHDIRILSLTNHLIHICNIQVSQHYLNKDHIIHLNYYTHNNIYDILICIFGIPFFHNLCLFSQSSIHKLNNSFIIIISALYILFINACSNITCHCDKSLFLIKLTL